MLTEITVHFREKVQNAVTLRCGEMGLFMHCTAGRSRSWGGQEEKLAVSFKENLLSSTFFSTPSFQEFTWRGMKRDMLEQWSSQHHLYLFQKLCIIEIYILRIIKNTQPNIQPYQIHAVYLELLQHCVNNTKKKKKFVEINIHSILNCPPKKNRIFTTSSEPPACHNQSYSSKPLPQILY